jgi:hypothetical protein
VVIKCNYIFKGNIILFGMSHTLYDVSGNYSIDTPRQRGNHKGRIMFFPQKSVLLGDLEDDDAPYTLEDKRTNLVYGICKDNMRLLKIPLGYNRHPILWRFNINEKTMEKDNFVTEGSYDYLIKNDAVRLAGELQREALKSLLKWHNLLGVVDYVDSNKDSFKEKLEEILSWADKYDFPKEQVGDISFIRVKNK